MLRDPDVRYTYALITVEASSEVKEESAVKVTSPLSAGIIVSVSLSFSQ